MPRVKTSNAPTKFGVNKALIQVRKATNRKTQTQNGFAAAVGMKPATLQKTEEGHRRLDLPEAIRIMAYTGADAQSLIKGKKAISFDKKTFNSAAFKRWREGSSVSKKAVEMSAERAGVIAEALVKASSNVNPSRYRMVIAKLLDVLKGVEMEFGLTEALEREFKEHYSQRKVQDIQFGSFVKQLSRDPSYAPAGWDATKAAKIADNKMLRLERTTFPEFNLTAGGSDWQGKPIIPDAVIWDRVIVRTKLPWSPDKVTEFDFTEFKIFCSQFGKDRPSTATLWKRTK
jgi:transcriptional regulator with XRE-family HTH domain